jgi:hypothetical protein
LLAAVLSQIKQTVGFGEWWVWGGWSPLIVAPYPGLAVRTAGRWRRIVRPVNEWSQVAQ